MFFSVTTYNSFLQMLSQSLGDFVAAGVVVWVFQAEHTA